MTYKTYNLQFLISADAKPDEEDCLVSYYRKRFVREGEEKGE